MGSNLDYQAVLRDVHDPGLHALQTTASLSASTVYVGNPTLYAVVNTGAAGDSTAKIGFATVAVSNPTLAVGGDVASGVADVGNPVKVGGKYLATLPTFTDGNRGDLNIGQRGALRVEMYQAGSTNSLVHLADNSDAFVTSATNNKLAVTNRNTVYNSAASVWDRMYGDTTNGVDVDVTRIADSKTFIGLVTSWSRNAGTTKTLVSLPVGLGNNSLATIAVPTNANRILVTNFLLNSNVTTEVAIKSGVTYLTGNASLGVTLFPGGGFELPGSPDSPSWIGLPSGALVIEKRDPGGTVSKIGGGVIYFDE